MTEHSPDDSEYRSATVLGSEQPEVGERNMSEAPSPFVDRLSAEAYIPVVSHVLNVITEVTAFVDGGRSLTSGSDHGGEA
jgi:hypothetical protein